jgi:uncharacterized protein
MTEIVLKMSIMEGSFGICRFDPGISIPEWVFGGSFISVTKTLDELSVVCPIEFIPDRVICEKNWRALKVEGPLDFSLTGILASISTILAQSGISIFAVSTYDTDYVLVREKDLNSAVDALSRGSCEIVHSKGYLHTSK